MEADEVKKMAHLARLAIDEGDSLSYAKDLSAILGLVEQMNRVDTRGVEAMAHPQDMVQRLRSDEVSEMDQREPLQSGAPLTENGLYLVPKVIE